MRTLLFLNPGHFHAALTLREAHPLVHEEIHVYAEPGPDLDAFLALVESFNSCGESPTRWKPTVYRGADPLGKLIAARKGEAVVLAGRNDSKMADIAALHGAGFHVLGDKPFLTGAHALPDLEAATADEGPLVMDMMMSRHEPAAIAMKLVWESPAVFGVPISQEEGSAPGDPPPDIFLESVHHLCKAVNGVPLVRPVWYFNPEAQGDGIVDVPSHLADLAQWMVGGAAYDYDEDVQLLSARLWDTAVPAPFFTRITGVPAFPGELRPWVREGELRFPCNGSITYRLRGHTVRLDSLWRLEGPDDGGDAKRMKIRGSLADLSVVRVADRLVRNPHGPRDADKPVRNPDGSVRDAEDGAKPRIVLRPHRDHPGWSEVLQDAVAGWQGALPGIAAVKLNGKTEGGRAASHELRIPPSLDSTHEEHFAMVLNEFLTYLDSGVWPDDLMPNLRAKYTLLARASQIAGMAARAGRAKGEQLS